MLDYRQGLVIIQVINGVVKPTEMHIQHTDRKGKTKENKIEDNNNKKKHKTVLA